MNKIQKKFFPEFNYAEYLQFLVGDITKIYQDLFGEGIVKYAWIILGIKDIRGNNNFTFNEEYLESLLQRKIDYYNKYNRFESDEDDIIIEFFNGNKIRIGGISDDGFSIDKGKELD